jgi:hypothetical protein
VPYGNENRLKASEAKANPNASTAVPHGRPSMLTYHPRCVPSSGLHYLHAHYRRLFAAARFDEGAPVHQRLLVCFRHFFDSTTYCTTKVTGRVSAPELEAAVIVTV